MLNTRKLLSFADEWMSKQPARNMFNSVNPDYWYYIPSYKSELECVIKDVGELQGKSFIDIGCGIPMIPRIFDILGAEKSVGLEYDNLYKRFYPDLIVGDLLTYDFKEFDILYSYNPIKNRTLMNEGIDNIIKTMKKGATFYFFNAGGLTADKKKKFKSVSNCVWKYIKK